MDDYKIIVEQEHQTVMAHFEAEPRQSEGYQSEAQLEKTLINQLKAQGYEYVQVKTAENKGEKRGGKELRCTEFGICAVREN